MFCQKCGAQVSTEVRFCPTCGQPLGPPIAPGSAGPVAWTPPTGVKAHPGRWVSEGWELVKADLGGYILATLVFVAINAVGSIVTQGALITGFHLFCIKKMHNRQTELGDLFKGFNYFLPALVASIVIALFTFGGTLLCIIPGLVVAAALKFTYLFIIDKKMDFWPAMQSSHAVVKNDYFGFTMFLLLMGLVDFLGFLCCIVGLFVTLPVTMAATTIAYKEVVGFEARTVEAL